MLHLLISLLYKNNTNGLLVPGKVGGLKSKYIYFSINSFIYMVSFKLQWCQLNCEFVRLGDDWISRWFVLQCRPFEPSQ